MNQTVFVARVLAAMLIDALFFAATVYAAHVGAFPKEAAVGICTALVIARTQTSRAAALGGQPGSSLAPPAGPTPPSSAVVALLAMGAGLISSKGSGT